MLQAQAQVEQPAPRLPQLREDLKLEAGATDLGGVPTWLIVDPVQHRYIQIGETAYQLLCCWDAGLTYAELAARASATFGQVIAADDIGKFVQFLAEQNLTVEAAAGWRHYSALAARGDQSWLMWAIHNYLFVRIPLVQPEPYLRRALPLVAPLFSKTFAWLIAGLGLLGLYLVSRQWEQFFATFQHFFSWRGAAIYGVALILIKSAHELGHAFVALRYGVRVPSMGVCFMVMVPMLYTDVTDAWRLKARAERIAIGSAGMLVELGLACVATFLWAFLPDGVARSLCFSIATVGWALSLIVNINPLMRFDGYYLFADAIGVDNLQQRAFAFGRWRLREFLFGLGAPPPERLQQRTATTLTIYAWATWLYRLMVFTGIALLVYHMAFKLLGIALFLIEIVFFILRPIAQEVRVWWRLGPRTLVGTRRARVMAAVAAVMAVLAVVPWSQTVSIPAVLEASELARVYPQQAGVVAEVRVRQGDRVAAGDALVVMVSDDITHRLRLAERRLALIRMRLERRSADSQDRAKSLTLEQELRSLNSEIDGLKRESENLTIKAPVAGEVVEFNRDLHVGRSISRAEFVALIKGAGQLVARGYVSEQDAARLNPSSQAVFISDIPGAQHVGLKLKDVARAAAGSIDMPELASHYGGEVAVRPQAGPGGHRRLTPVDARYLAVLDAQSDSPLPAMSVRGVAILDGAPQSLAASAWRRVAAVLVRESGF